MPWALVLALPACDPALHFKNPPIPPDKTAVLLNGEPISLAEFDTEFRLMAIHYSAVSETQMRAIKRRLFDQVVDRRLIVQEARKEGVGLTREEWNRDVNNAFAQMPDDFLEILRVQGVSEEAWKHKLMQECLATKLVERDVNSKVKITPREVEDYYWSHLSDYWKPESVHIQHLVVRKHGDLKKALKRLKSGEAFTQVAKDLSLADDKEQGGDWGLVPVDDVPKPYLKILRRLKPGQISKPFHDNFGYHLFRLIGFEPRKMRDFAQVRRRIDDSLLKEEQDSRFDQWMLELKRHSVLRVNPDLAPVLGITLEGSHEK